MSNNLVAKCGGAFFELLFLRLHSERTAKLPVAARVLVYVAAFVLFYFPILYFAAKKCIENHELIAYVVIVIAIHVFAKIMLCSSKKIQRRFASVKGHKHFLIRTWLVLEYVVFMWIVYLFYPLVCVFVPLATLAMSIESMLGFSMVFDLLMQSSETFLLVGGMISYVIFIVADGYRKLKSGFLPDYLGLYVVLTVVSAAIGRVSQRLVDIIAVDVSRLAGTLSWIFSVSNNAMNIVASVMALLFAVHSLYKNCGTGTDEQSEDESSRSESPVGRP